MFINYFQRSVLKIKDTVMIYRVGFLEQTLGQNAQLYTQAILYLALTNSSMTSQKDMTENPRKSPRVPPNSATCEGQGDIRRVRKKKPTKDSRG